MVSAISPTVAPDSTAAMMGGTRLSRPMAAAETAASAACQAPAFRLARSAFEEPPAQQAHADADAQRAEADEDRDSNRGHTNHSFHL